MLFKKKYSINLVLLLFIILESCSTQKNTWKTRNYHAFTTRYNVYFNGHQAYLKGEKSIAKNHKENYTRIISMYRISDMGTKATGNSEFESALGKSKIAIKAHSIKAKPKKNRDKMKDPKYLRFINQEEFNPFLYRAWFLWGNSLFHQGKYEEASSVFSYIARHYASNDELANHAYIWKFRCYNELKWMYEAEDMLHKIDVLKLSDKNKNFYNAIYCDYLLKNKKYEEAIPLLEKAIDKAAKLDKTRWKFLLAQLYQQAGKNSKAYEMYGNVIRKSPPYEMELNARIKQTEVFTGKNKKEIVSKLNRMTKSRKNKEFLDQIYYALGNLYLDAQDTTQAIKQYATGVSRSTRKGIDKAVCLLKLGDLYYAQHHYMKAQPCYSEAFGIVDKESEEYKRLAKLCPILDEMAVYARNVEEQDSIQKLTKMPEIEKMKVIQEVIDRVKKERKEKEAENIKNAVANNQQAGSNIKKRENSTIQPKIASNNTDKSWYFYNPTLVSQGKTDFQSQWGNRKLEDNWRRKDKSSAVFSSDTDNGANSETIPSDSTTKQESTMDSTAINKDEAENDSAMFDPERPEFYLAQLPVTEEDFAASDALIREGLYNVGIILKNRLNDYHSAVISLEDLIARFPDNEFLADTYYNLFQIYYRWGNKEKAEYYRMKLINEFPDNENSILLASPNFEEEFFLAKQIQDSVYKDTYNAYLDNNSYLVKKNYDFIHSRYPKAELMPKYMFVYALSLLKEGDKEGFKEILSSLLKEFPGSDLNELATAIGKGIYEGRDLADGGSISSNIWERKLAGNDSVQTDTVSIKFSTDRETPYLLLFAYSKDSINNNKLLFDIANYNFSNFLVKSFDLEFSTYNDIELLIISGFNSFDDVTWYKQMFYEREILNTEMNKKIRPIVISTENFELLKKYFSFEDYFQFFEDNFNQTDTVIE